MTDSDEYTLPELPYAYDGLEPAYASEMLALHHDKHHASYVSGVNAALADLAQARHDADYSALNQLEKDLAFNLSGHVLHSIFWRNMSPDGGGQPAGRLAADIEKARWVEQFWEIVNWDDVARRFDRSRQVTLEPAA